MAKADTDAQLLQAALQTVLDNGYGGATTRQIAAAAGVNEVTLFRKFGNKQHLLLAAVEREVTAFGQPSLTYTGDLEGDLRAIVSFYSRVMHKHGRLIAMLLTEVPRHVELRDVLQRPFGLLVQLTALIERYQAEGQLMAESPSHTIAALLGPLLAAALMGAMPPAFVPEPLDPTQYVQRFLKGRQRHPSSTQP